jgi:hypothetical protein
MLGVIACLSGLIVAAPGSANPPYDAGPRTKTLSALLHDQTYAVAHVDLTRLDAEKVLKAAAAVLPEDRREECQEPLQAFKKFQTAFTKAGGTVLIFLFDAEDLPWPSYIYVPLTEKADRDTLTKLLQEFFPLGRGTKVQKVGDLLVAGTETTLKRLPDHREPAARPELASAVQAAGDTAVQVLLMPTKGQRRVIEEALPHLPKELGGRPSKQLTQGLRWAALGFDGEPKFSFRWTIQAADVNTAKTVSALLQTGMEAVGSITFRGEDKPLAELLGKEYGRAVKTLTPEVKEDRLVFSWNEAESIRSLVSCVVAAIDRLPGVANGDCENLQELALALHGYHSKHGHFPPNAVRSRDDKPLLSWRVALLPHLGQDDLYKQFKLDEPWDSEHNKKLIEKMPAVFRSPKRKGQQPGFTTYLAPIGDDFVFTGKDKGTAMKDIGDGTSNTIFLVDASDERAVIWTKPDDLVIDAKEPLKSLIGHYPNCFVVAFADSSVQQLPKNLPVKTLLALFTCNGGEVVKIPPK